MKVLWDCAKAKGFTENIMEFIALDYQQFSAVEDVGFRRLIWHIETPLCPRGRIVQTCFNLHT